MSFVNCDFWYYKWGDLPMIFTQTNHEWQPFVNRHTTDQNCLLFTASHIYISFLTRSNVVERTENGLTPTDTYGFAIVVYSYIINRLRYCDVTQIPIVTSFWLIVPRTFLRTRKLVARNFPPSSSWIPLLIYRVRVTTDKRVRKTFPKTHPHILWARSFWEDQNIFTLLSLSDRSIFPSASVEIWHKASLWYTS